MMRPCVILLLALSALLCSVRARQVSFVAARLPNQIQQSPFLSAPSAQRPNVARCYGLARKTRTQKVQVPVLYNSVSRQTAAVPDYLFSLDDRTIDKMEAQGWEVRMKTIMMPDTFYQRVPVCCPWDTACYHNQHQGPQMPLTQSTPSMGPCMNGGRLMPRGTSQVCVCPDGYQGVWCQIPSTVRPSFPAGPVIPYRKVIPSNAEVLRQAVMQAQLWKQKMLSTKQSPVIIAGHPMNKAPLLSPNDHFITSVNQPWVQQNPSDKALRMKMAMIMNLYLKQQGRQPQMMTPIYNQAKDFRTNPYSAGPTHPFINPQMVSMLNHLQGRGGMPAPINPLGQPLMPVQTYSRGNIARNKGMTIPQARTPWDMDPWDRQRSTGSGQTVMGGPSMAVGRGQAMADGPSMAYGRGQAMGNDPSMAYGRDKLMAMAFAQYINNLQKRMTSAQANGYMGRMPQNRSPQINRRVPIREPPMTDMDPDYHSNPAIMDSVNNNLPPFQSDQYSGTTEGPSHVADKEITSVELPGPIGGRGDSNQQRFNQANIPMTGQGMGQLTGSGPITSQQNPLMNDQPMPQGVNPMNNQMLQGMPMGAAGPMPTMPSKEELQRMTQCRVVLEPRITTCMNDAGHALTLEQFMNPEYMNTARGVCEDSEVVGQCVMRQDQVCGEGPVVDMTRKMIGSVLQMMGMVCGQIVKMDQESGRHEPQVPGIPPQPANPPRLATIPQSINIHRHTDSPADETLTSTTTPTQKLGSPEHPENPSKSSDKFSTSKIGGAVTDGTPSKAASKSDKGHHSVEPVTSESFIPGAPLWVVILVACIVLIISCLSLILIVLVVRKRRVEKTRMIERKAGPLDPNMYTIGIPPPQYATASIKTQDELTLPPLDLAEEDESCPESGNNSDGGDEDDDVKKPPVSDDDADDESDEKDDDVEKKKKEKKERNNKD